MCKCDNDYHTLFLWLALISNWTTNQFIYILMVKLPFTGTHTKRIYSRHVFTDQRKNISFSLRSAYIPCYERCVSNHLASISSSRFAHRRSKKKKKKEKSLWKSVAGGRGTRSRYKYIYIYIRGSDIFVAAYQYS